MKKLVIKAIELYRNYISCNKIRCCRFFPSCSQYTIDAINSYGLVIGLMKGLKRVLRCHPFSAGGYDPA